MKILTQTEQTFDLIQKSYLNIFKIFLIEKLKLQSIYKKLYHST